ncbi:MAG TPA: hypothetical protein VFR66_02125 [Burkholderiales bacterium]|nr:hypothetical protein [Burkholderiales bacterium]
MVPIRLAFVGALEGVAGRLDTRGGVHFVITAYARTGGRAAAAHIGAALDPGVRIDLERGLRAERFPRQETDDDC